MEPISDPLPDAETTNAPEAFVDDYLLYLLAAVSSHASDEFHAHVRRAGLRVPEWRVLACLIDQDGAMVTRLARLSLYEQSRMTKTIDQMVTRGLVRRAPDPNDARRVRVYLTDTGRALAMRLRSDAKDHELRILNGLGAEESAAIKPILKKILRLLEDNVRGT